MNEPVFSLLTDENTQKALALSKNGAAECFVYTRLLLSQGHLPDSGLWTVSLENKITAAAADCFGELFFCGAAAFLPEMLQALTKATGAAYVYGKGGLLKQAGFLNSEEIFVMKYTCAPPDVTKSAAVKLDNSKIPDMLIKLGNSPKDESFSLRFSELCRRVNHSLGSINGIEQNGSCVAFASVVASNADSAVIGDVFTVPEHRGRGYAGECVNMCVGDTLSNGLKAYVLCRKPLTGFYENLGFTTEKTISRADASYINQINRGNK